jgi:hypothetical protein
MQWGFGCNEDVEFKLSNRVGPEILVLLEIFARRSAVEPPPLKS